jgi:hypothetical protein
MATPSTLLRENAESSTLYIATFGSTADGDTWATGLGNNIIGFWGNSITNGTQTKEGVDISNSAGTLTFNLGETKSSGIMVYVLART